MSSTTEHGPIVARFRTLGGGVTAVTQEAPEVGFPGKDHTWHCDCGKIRMDGLTTIYRADLATVRGEADRHAGQCRAMPR